MQPDQLLCVVFLEGKKSTIVKKNRDVDHLYKQIQTTLEDFPQVKNEKAILQIMSRL